MNLIEYVEIKGLLSYEKKIIKLKFNSDINIITGINGQGKTTLLKLVWYIYSGNLRKALEEIEFDYIKLRTTLYTIDIFKSSEEKMSKLSENHSHTGYDITVVDNNDNSLILDTTSSETNRKDHTIDYCSKQVSILNKKSLYFPTFRRIEGFPSKPSSLSDSASYRDDAETLLSDTMRKISSRLSRGNHSYITSVSTKDINELITNKYAEVSEKINKTYKSLTDDIEYVINSKNKNSTQEDFNQQLDSIKKLIDDHKNIRTKGLEPIEAISKIVNEVFKRKGVMINNSISLGQQKQLIDSNYLSAGEKQMLSFIAYNALHSNTPIIIDEPEISLHVDWQRKLLRILRSQNTQNQLIIATHSPFIYAKYSDKEIIKDFEEKSIQNDFTDSDLQSNYIDFQDFLKSINNKDDQ